MNLFWHRADLRIRDNRGLAQAAEGTALPAFVFDDEVLAHASPPRVAFMLDALAALRAAYRERGSDLLTIRGDPAVELPALADEHGADGVVWNRDYSGLARDRDGRVREALDAAGRDPESLHDALLHEPGSITTAEGDPYRVYSYFWRKWRDREKDDPVPAPDPDDLADASGEPLPSLDDLGFQAPEADLPTAGSEAARGRLTEFCDGPIYAYGEEREYPAQAATSRLSQDLKWGTLGIRETYAETAAATAAAPDEAARESVRTYRSELAWREFYAHVLRFRPGAVTEDFRDFERPIEWRDDPEEIRAWKTGETGYPIVDAGMRQLRAEAFVHNRVRMIVASFLTKDLLADWRHGYRHFRAHLLDHDPASDSGGWQWAASTGTDAQPYFRVFNPMTQGERYDPDAAYVREYVPELRDADAEAVHGWHELDESERAAQAPDYPAPIVDHAERREAAIETFERARGDTDD
jgi:deoxyribodipyrimidine photo-lyase